MVFVQNKVSRRLTWDKVGVDVPPSEKLTSDLGHIPIEELKECRPQQMRSIQAWKLTQRKFFNFSIPRSIPLEKIEWKSPIVIALIPLTIPWFLSFLTCSDKVPISNRSNYFPPIFHSRLKHCMYFHTWNSWFLDSLALCWDQISMKSN